MKHNPILFFMLVTIFISCNQESLLVVPQPYQPPTDIREIIPMEVGYQWTYRAFRETICCDTCYDYCIDTIMVTRTVVDTISYSGKIHYKILVEQNSGDRPYIYQLEYVDSSRFVRWVDYSEGFPIWPVPILVSPVLRGSRWEYFEPPVRDTSIVTSIDTSITINGRRYEHGILIDHSFLDEQTLIVPGIGIVWDLHYDSYLGALYFLTLIGKNF